MVYRDGNRGGAPVSDRGAATFVASNRNLIPQPIWKVPVEQCLQQLNVGAKFIPEFALESLRQSWFRNFSQTAVHNPCERVDPTLIQGWLQANSKTLEKRRHVNQSRHSGSDAA